MGLQHTWRLGGGGGAARKGVLVSVWVRGNQRGFGSTHGGWGGGGEGRQKKGCWSVFGCGGIKGGLAAHMEAGGGRAAKEGVLVSVWM